MDFTSQTVNTATNSTVIEAKNCELRGVYVNTVLSAHTVVIEDAAGVSVMTLPASLPAGTYIPAGDARVAGLTVNPDDSSTGNITVIYRVLQ